MILTESGEIGVHVANKTYLLRPSFYAMSQMGSPSEIVEIYATVMAEIEEHKLKERQFQDALFVIYSCSESDLTEVFGYVDEQMQYVERLASKDDVLTLARCLLKHGVTGAHKPEPMNSNEPPEYLTEFKASDCAAMAIAHLGFSEREAWGLTMTSLTSALRSKYPKTKESGQSRAPTKTEHEDTMDWFDKIKQRRASTH